MMDLLNEKKMKEMEEEMSRFEKEISSHSPSPSIQPVAPVMNGVRPPPPPPVSKSEIPVSSMSNSSFVGPASSSSIPFVPPQLRSRLPPPPPPPQTTATSHYARLTLPPPPPPSVPPAAPPIVPPPIVPPTLRPIMTSPGMGSGSIDSSVISAQPKLVYAAPPKIITKNGTTSSSTKSDTFERDLMELLGKSSDTFSSELKASKSNEVHNLTANPSSTDNDEMEIDPEATSKPTVMSVTAPKPKSSYKRETAAQVSLQGRATNKKKKFVRTAAGQVWEDPTLIEWDPNDFRIFCGDLGNEVSDDVLTRAFSRYPSFQKAKIVRDKRTGKTRGFGFVSFSDAADFTKAMREMNGKYVGNRPIKLKRSDWRNRQIEVVKKRDKEKRKLGFKV